MDRLGDRLDDLRQAGILVGGFHHRDDVVRMALLADHALLAEAGVLRQAGTRWQLPDGQLAVKLVPWSKSCSASMLIAAPFRREYQSESTPGDDAVVGIPETVLRVGHRLQCRAGIGAAVREGEVADGCSSGC